MSSESLTPISSLPDAPREPMAPDDMRKALEDARGAIDDAHDDAAGAARALVDARSALLSIEQDLHADLAVERSLSGEVSNACRALRDADVDRGTIQDLERASDRAVGALAETRKAVERMGDVIGSLVEAFDLMLGAMRPTDAIHLWRLLLLSDRSFAMQSLARFGQEARREFTPEDVDAIAAKPLMMNHLRGLRPFLRWGGSGKPDVDRRLFQLMLAFSPLDALSLVEEPNALLAQLAPEDLAPLFEHEDQSVRLRAMAAVEQLPPPAAEGVEATATPPEIPAETPAAAPARPRPVRAR